MFHEPTCISCSGWMWSVESSSRLQNHDRAGFCTLATEKFRPRWTSTTLTPLIPNTLLAAKKPYNVSAGTLSCQWNMKKVWMNKIYPGNILLCSSLFLTFGQKMFMSPDNTPWPIKVHSKVFLPQSVQKLHSKSNGSWQNVTYYIYRNKQIRFL